MTCNTDVYTLLKWIGKLEEVCGCNDGSYNYHRKITCKYCKCKCNTSLTHDHEDESVIFQRIKDEYCIGASKIDIADTDEATVTCESWFDLLPVCVLDKIFKHCTHDSLANISQAYPYFVHLCMDPSYWSHLYIDFNDSFINSNQMERIFRYLNKNLKHLSLKDCRALNNDHLDLYFGLMPKLQRLELGSVKEFNGATVDLLVTHLEHLEFINFEWNSKLMRDEYLLKLLNLQYLNAIDMSYCENLTNFGVLKFVNSIKALKYFNIDGVQHVQDLTILLLCERHARTLESLVVDGEHQSDSAFKNLPLCKNLKEFRLSYGEQFTKELLEHVSTLNQLESFTLRHTDIDSCAFEWFFSQSTLTNMRILNLEKCNSLGDSSLLHFPKCCPNLEELNISWCWEIGDEGLDAVIKNCSKLTHLDLSGLSGVRGDVFRNVPHLYLPNIKYINLTYCRGIGDNQEFFKEMAINHPNITVIDYYNTQIAADNAFSISTLETSDTENGN